MSEDFQQKLAKFITYTVAVLFALVALPFYAILALMGGVGRVIDEFLAGLRR